MCDEFLEPLLVVLEHHDEIATYLDVFGSRNEDIELHPIPAHWHERKKRPWRDGDTGIHLTGKRADEFD